MDDKEEPANGDDALVSLLEAEERIASLVAESEKKAAAIVAAAEAQARQQLAHLDVEIDRQRQALAASIEAGSRKLADNVEREATATVARYNRLTDEEIADLAAFVVAEVIGSGPEGSK